MRERITGAKNVADAKKHVILEIDDCCTLVSLDQWVLEQGGGTVQEKVLWMV